MDSACQLIQLILPLPSILARSFDFAYGSSFIKHVSPSDPIASFSRATYHPVEMTSTDVWSLLGGRVAWGSFVNKIRQPRPQSNFWLTGLPALIRNPPKRVIRDRNE